MIITRALNKANDESFVTDKLLKIEDCMYDVNAIDERMSKNEFVCFAFYHNHAMLFVLKKAVIHAIKITNCSILMKI